MKILLPYRGSIQTLSHLDTQCLFVTTHEEQQATELYSIMRGKDDIKLGGFPLPCGAYDVLVQDNLFYIAGEDGKIYTLNGSNPIKALGKLNFADDATFQLQSMADSQLALLQQRQLCLINSKGTIKQTLALHETATVMASNPSGEWLAIGFQNGEIAVYSYEDGQLVLSSQATIHQGQVSALAFEKNELRFYSAGTDKKLFHIHAQGELQALDKGKSSNHQVTINSIVIGENHFYTGANDKSIKAWAYSGGKPVTINKGLGKVAHLALLNHDNKTSLVAACSDNSIRLMPLSSEGVPNEVNGVLNDAYALSKELLTKSRQEPKEADSALTMLKGFDDKKSFALLEKQLKQDAHKDLKQKIIAIAKDSQHPDSTKLLETALADKQHDVVRLAAFDALVARMAKTSIRPYELALDSNHVDIGTNALQALAKRAKKEPLAEQALIKALKHSQRSLRLLTLNLLEGVYTKTDPKASLLALQIEHPELQRAALIRLYQRQLLANNDVQRAILVAQDDNDAWLRHNAFLIAILSQPDLAKALKERDLELARQLDELESFDLLKAEASDTDKAKDSKTKQAAKSKAAAKTTASKKTKTDLAAPKLSEANYTPLLQSMVSRHNDICFAAGFALAVLQDQRAFGLLLMLSQEDDIAIRTGICRAFALLKQPDALQQLAFLLDDEDESVRDAAFIALAELVEDPHQAVNYGFKSQYENIHQHALKTLLDTQGKKKKLSDEALVLLKQALNDPFKNVRQETFKACLNRQLGGDLTATLRLLLSSYYDDIHHEVLNELLANLKQDWAQTLLLEQLNNPYHGVREKALQQALKEKKLFVRHEVLKQAIGSSFEDMRHAALKQLKSRPSKQDWLLLQGLLNDEIAELRLEAIQAVSVSDDTTALIQALSSYHDDVKLYAAISCAKQGLTQAYDVLADFAAREKPQDKQQHTQWQDNVKAALEGLAALEDKRASDIVFKHALSNNDILANTASTALPWVTDNTHAGALGDLLTHDNKTLSAYAALSLVLLDNIRGGNILQDKQVLKQLPVSLQLASTLSQQPITVVSLRQHINQKHSFASATLAFLAHEYVLHGDQPELSIKALTLDNPSIRRLAADMMSQYDNEDQRWTYLQSWFSQQLKLGDKADWLESLDTLKQIAAVLVHGDNHLKAQLLIALTAINKGHKREYWQRDYQAFSQRYAKAIKQAESQVNIKKPKKAAKAQWQQTAFGAYLGLIRLDERNPVVFNIRLQAIKGLCYLANEGNAQLKQSVISCLLTLLNHSHGFIRQAAYQSLLDLNIPLDTLGNAATTSRYEEIATAGLNLLVTHYPLKKSRQLLEETVVKGMPVLAQAAYKLLSEDESIGLIALAPFALQSFTQPIRMRCVRELSANYDNKKAQALLIEASQNDDSSVKLHSLKALADHKHPKALSLIDKAWHSSESEAQQSALLTALGVLRTDGVSQFLLDSLDNKDTLKITPKDLYSSIGYCRDISVADNLLARLQQKTSDAPYIIDALTMISGYNQTIHDDPDDEDEHDKALTGLSDWLDKQHPRHDYLLVDLFTSLVKLDYHKQAKGLLEGMQWMAENSKTDTALAQACAVANDEFLAELLETVSIRARRRNGSVDALLAQLGHKNPELQFLAAEGLARSGHIQGNSVLLSASEYLDELAYRERAIIALGESGDANVFEHLLNLAENTDHALNEEAIEAIGHLGSNEQAKHLVKKLTNDLKPSDDKVLKLLTNALNNSSLFSNLRERALNGLRWLNTNDSWHAICDFIENSDDYASAYPIKLLRYWDNDYSREFLLKTISHGDYQATENAYHSACYLLKPRKNEASDVDLALMQSHYGITYLGDGKTLERVCRYATSEQLLDLLNGKVKYYDKHAIYQQLQQALLQRDTLNANDLVKGLAAERSETVGIIAHITALTPKITKTVQTALQQALERHDDLWQQQWLRHQKDPQAYGSLEERDNMQQVISNLFNASIMQQVKSPVLIDYLQSHEPYKRHLHNTLLNRLLTVDKSGDKTLIATVSALQNSPALETRQLAQQWLYQQKGIQKTLHWECFTHQPDILTDKSFAPALVESARNDKQARALPMLIRQQDSKTLYAIANDTKLDEVQRIGAIEGLGQLHSEAAEKLLQKLCKQKEADADIGRAAFRALRRSQRIRQKAALNHTLNQGDAA